MFGNKEAVDLDKEMSDAVKRPSIVESLAAANRQVVQMRPAASQRLPLEHTACWMRSLRYEDMMQMATEMHAIKSSDSVDTPEQLAKLLHAWAKVTTEPSSQD
jgi:hypothetical protein